MKAKDELRERQSIIWKQFSQESEKPFGLYGRNPFGLYGIY